MIAPAFQYLVYLVFHMFHNFIALGQYICLFLRGYISSDGAFNSPDQGLHQVGGVNKFKGNVFDGLFIMIDDRIEQHCLKVYICLILGNGLEGQLYRSVLYRDPGVDGFYQGDL